MKITDQGQIYFLHVPTGVSSWHDPRIPKDLNLQTLCDGDRSLDDVLGAMPSGWERRETTSGRPYFLDHASRTTQFTDPRLYNNANLRLLLNTANASENNTSESSSAQNSNENNNGVEEASESTNAGGDQEASTTTTASVANVRATTSNNSVIMPTAATALQPSRPSSSSTSTPTTGT